jgi:hypothetical protein
VLDVAEVPVVDVVELAVLLPHAARNRRGTAAANVATLPTRVPNQYRLFMDCSPFISCQLNGLARLTRPAGPEGDISNARQSVVRHLYAAAAPESRGDHVATLCSSCGVDYNPISADRPEPTRGRLERSSAENP